MNDVGETYQSATERNANPYFTSEGIDELPQSKTFATREKALQNLKTWGSTRGYVFTIRRSKTKKKGERRCKVLFGCDLKEKPKSQPLPPSPSDPLNGNDIGEGGENGENGENGTVGSKRKRTSKGTGCQYSIICAQILDASAWEITYREPWTVPRTGEVIDSFKHNHPPREIEGGGGGSTKPRRERSRGEGERRGGSRFAPY